MELLSLTQPNEALEEVQSEHYDTGKKFTYVFTPDHGRTFTLKLPESSAASRRDSGRGTTI